MIAAGKIDQSFFKFTEYIHSTFDVGRSMFDVRQFLFRLDWPLFCPAAGLTPDTYTLDTRCLGFLAPERLFFLFPLSLQKNGESSTFSFYWFNLRALFPSTFPSSHLLSLPASLAACDLRGEFVPQSRGGGCSIFINFLFF